MKIFSNVSKSLLLIFSVLLLCGCNQGKVETVEGYIVKIESNKILVAEDITLDKFEAIKDKPIGDYNDDISLIYFFYDDLSNFQVGNKVRVLYDGGMDESNPAQASALEIEVIK